MDSKFAGSTVRVIDAAGSTVGMGTVGAGPISESGHCGWKATVSGVDDSDFYSVSVDMKTGFSDEVAFSREEFDSQDWSIGIQVPYRSSY